VADLFLTELAATHREKLSKRLQATHAANDTKANSARSSESLKIRDHSASDTISSANAPT